jgi:LacI family transcriptional regulator, gluconate utilization system Gnt-I transcriptional repressor
MTAYIIVNHLFVTSGGRIPAMTGKNTSYQSYKLSDVARTAGVSVITASRALRQPELVAPATLDRVRRAVSDLGYVPNPAAQALASARSPVIGVIIPSVTNWVFAELLRGVTDATEGTSLQPQFVNTRYVSAREDELVRLFAAQRPAGMIVAGIDQSPAARAALSAMGCPVVQVMETSDDPIDMMIGSSQIEAARAITRHMIEQGYRRIGFLGARMDPRAQRRLHGYRQELEAAGLADLARVLTTPQASAVTIGRRLMADFLALHPGADAVFCNNDDIALGAMFECMKRGIRVPAQMGIAGFNDLDMAEGAVPGISSVRTHRYEMGFQAVKMIEAANAGARPDPAVVDLGFALKLRDSTLRTGEAR